MDVANLSIVDACCKPLQLCKQLPLPFEEDEKPTKRCSTCKIEKPIEGFYGKQSQCRKCKSRKVMEIQRRNRGYGKVRDRVILKQCQLCEKKVKTTDFNQRRNVCLDCASKQRKKEKEKPSCVQCGKPCSEKRNRFCSFACFNENRSFGFVEITCSNCGKVFTRKKRLAQKYSAHACSVQCANIVKASRMREVSQERRPKKTVQQVKKDFYEKRRQKRLVVNSRYKSLWFKKANRKIDGESNYKSTWYRKSMIATQTNRTRHHKAKVSKMRSFKDWDLCVRFQRKAIKSISVRRVRSDWKVKCETRGRELRRSKIRTSR
jgi:hypothetical protein